MQENIGVIFAVLFLFQLFSLYLFSRLLIQSLARLFYTITQSHTTTVHLLAFFFLPGTFVHEAAHAFTATIMLVTVHDFHLMPKVEETGIKLGSVEITKTDPFRRALIGVAPIIFGVGILLIIAYLLETKIPITFGTWWILLLLGYSIFVISNTMFSSRKDMEGLLLVNALLIAIIGGLLILKMYTPFIWIAGIFNTHSDFIFKLNLYLLVPILVDILIYGIFKFFKLVR
jgi:hypothetical protein